jgi:hypothetical protein
MKFISIRTLIALSFVLPLVLAGCTDGDEDISYEDDVKPLIEEENPSTAVRGSCNAIPFGSTCVDYIGSLWTEEQMRLNCGGSNTSFSLDACPYSDLGGCRATKGTITETIIWNYPYGGQPFTEEDAGYAAMACNALTVGSWVSSPEELLGE